ERMRIGQLENALRIIRTLEYRPRDAERKWPIEQFCFHGSNIFLSGVVDREVQRQPVSNDWTTDVSVDCPLMVRRFVSRKRVSRIQTLVLKCREKIAVKGTRTASLNHFSFGAASSGATVAGGRAGLDIERVVRYADLLDFPLVVRAFL